MHGQDGQEENRQGDLGVNEALRRKPFMLWPDLVSGPTHLFPQTWQLSMSENHILNFNFPYMKPVFPRLLFLHNLTFLELQNLSKMPKRSLQIILYFLNPCVCVNLWKC